MASTTKKDTELRETAGRVSLHSVPGETDLESGVLIRSMYGADLDLVKELRSVVSWSGDPGAFDLLRGMRDARWAVAESREGALVGMVGAVPLGEIGILCHLAVHEGYRGYGLGARLTAWAVAYLRSRGAALIRLYSTRQAEKIYHSAGFRSTTPRIVYRLEDAGRTPRSHRGGYSVEPLTVRDLSEIYGLDLWSYGADRSALILATLRLHPGQGLVARDSGGRIKGYLVRSANTHAVRVGPFMAESPEVARLLLGGCLKSCTLPVEATVTAQGAAEAHALFEEFGFTGRRDRLQMELGSIPGTRKKGLGNYGTTPYLAT